MEAEGVLGPERDDAAPGPGSDAGSDRVVADAMGTDAAAPSVEEGDAEASDRGPEPTGDTRGTGDADVPDEGAEGLAARAEDYRAFLAEAERVLDDVDRALARLDDGTYGVCATCGEAIGDEHLAEAPTSVRCERHLPLATPA